MATSRTGSTRWLNLRARLIRTRPHVCHWCRAALDPKAPRGTAGAIEVDHLMPVVTHPHLEFDLENLVLACRTCNRAKGDRVAPGAPASGVDLHGIRILDPRVTCRVHFPIKASCPHSGALQ